MTEKTKKPGRLSEARKREIEAKFAAAGVDPRAYMKLPDKIRRHIWQEVVEGAIDGVAPTAGAEQPQADSQLRQDVIDMLYGALAPLVEERLGSIRRTRRSVIKDLWNELARPETADQVAKDQVIKLNEIIHKHAYLEDRHEEILRAQGRLNAHVRNLLRQIIKEDTALNELVDRYSDFKAEIDYVLQSYEDAADLIGEEALEIPIETTLPLVIEPPGHLIKWLREVYGWSQAKLAQKAGCKQQNIQQLETGAVWKSDWLTPIADALGADVSWFEWILEYMPPRGERTTGRVVEGSATMRPFKKDTTPPVFSLDSLPYKFLARNADDKVGKHEHFSQALKNVAFVTVAQSKGFSDQIPQGSLLMCGGLSETVLDGQFFIGIAGYPYAELASAQVFQAKVLKGTSTTSGKFILKVRHDDEGYPFHDVAPLHRCFAGTGTADNSPPIRIVARVMGVYTSFDPVFDAMFTPDPRED